MTRKHRRSELGKLKIASQTHSSKRTICLWHTPDNDDTEFNCLISDDSLMIVIEESKDYLKIITENNTIGWIHISNTQDLDE